MASAFAQAHFPSTASTTTTTTTPTSTSTSSSSQHSATRRHQHNHQHTAHLLANRSPMTREKVLAMARNEYARQLCKFTEAQLKQRVPSCSTNSDYRAHIAKTVSARTANEAVVTRRAAMLS